MFQAGDVVRIINHNSLLYGEVLMIDSQKENYYILNLANGKKITCYHQDIVSWLKPNEYKKLYRAQLIQMQILAVDTDDREWFDKLGEIYNHIQIHISNETDLIVQHLNEHFEGEMK